jgi:hypothetical protein
MQGYVISENTWAPWMMAQLPLTTFHGVTTNVGLVPTFINTTPLYTMRILQFSDTSRERVLEDVCGSDTVWVYVPSKSLQTWIKLP